MKNFNRYFEAVKYLEGLSNLPADDYMSAARPAGVFLKRMKYFLDCIGNPERGLKVIHITGTSGKGSVTNMTHEVLHAAGKKVGSFTSPFVTTSIEKIKVGDLYIDPDVFADLVDQIKSFIDEAYLNGPYGKPSYFELFLAIAFLYFKKEKCEYVVLEVGCGGRYDATNIIPNPLITAITNIDFDHTKLLGKTLEKIALDKGGIIKKGSVFFTTEKRPKLLHMFADICNIEKASFNVVSVEGDYQEQNIALVKAIAEQLGIADAHIQKGIKNAKLQCRFELMQKNPQVILDGAHNRSKIQSTVHNLKQLTFNKLHLIIGIGESKDSTAILEHIIPVADRISFTRFQLSDKKCAHPKDLLIKAKKYIKKGAGTDLFLDAKQAFDEALKKASPNDLILVAGSFFLAGEIRKKWFKEETILAKRKSF